MTPTRRSFLRRLGLAAAGTAAGLLALPDPPTHQRAARPDGTVEGTFDLPAAVTDDAETDYVRWQYAPTDSGFRPTSPVNVAITLADSDRSFADVVSVFRAADWYERPVEYHRYAPDTRGDSERFERQHVTAAGNYFGGYGRLHVRLWAFGDAVSVQAHEDTPATPRHRIASHETGKRAVEWLFAEAGWDVSPDAVEFDNAKDPDHDGRVTVIR